MFLILSAVVDIPQQPYHLRQGSSPHSTNSGVSPHPVSLAKAPLDIPSNPTPADIDACSTCTGDSGFEEYIHVQPNNTLHKVAAPPTKPKPKPKPSSVPLQSYMNIGIITPSTSAPPRDMPTHSDDEGK